MDIRKQRRYQIVIFALTLACVALLYLVLAIGFYQRASGQVPNVSGVIIERPTPPLNAKRSDHRPDIRHCFKDERIVLWDCIRHEDEIGNAIREQMLREDM